MNNNIIIIQNLSHRYIRDWAIKDINFEISNRGVLGLLGSNGAGKSTTMNILAGVLNQTEGKVLIDGIDTRERPEEAKRKLGFLPQHAPLHLDLNVDEYLTYCAHIRDVPAKIIKKSVHNVKDKCGLNHFSKRLLSNLSGGYKQRVGIAQAIIHNPKLVVLDEPTNGLDPNQILEVRKLIKEISQERAVLFSTHMLSEVQATCQEIRMIEGGRMVFSDTMEAFNNYIMPNSVILYLDNPPDMLTLFALPDITEVEPMTDGGFRLHFKGFRKDISRMIIEKSMIDGWQLSQIILEKSSLEEIFAQLSNFQKPA